VHVPRQESSTSGEVISVDPGSGVVHTSLPLRAFEIGLARRVNTSMHSAEVNSCPSPRVNFHKVCERQVIRCFTRERRPQRWVSGQGQHAHVAFYRQERRWSGSRIFRRCGSRILPCGVAKNPMYRAFWPKGVGEWLLRRI